jgi:hypothetical protein
MEEIVWKGRLKDLNILRFDGQVQFGRDYHDLRFPRRLHASAAVIVGVLCGGLSSAT